jgi:glycosyltransferase involved in cell wall biosynthesis
MISGIAIKTVKYKTDLLRDIKGCSYVHCWSGLTDVFSNIVKIANLHKKPVILGPNLLDTVDLKKEASFLNNVEYKKILTVNKRLRHLLSDKHLIKRDDIDSFIVGPDLDVWTPPDKYGKYILWKGNSKHMVKDIGFAKKIKDKLKMYDFMFMGESRGYNYNDHIDAARKAYLYISTSISETKGMALLEQWSAGVPSVTHPGIYQHGRHYDTGIIVNRDVDSYCKAITEIMESNDLREDLSSGARNYMLKNFSSNLIVDKYFGILKNVG